MCSANDTLDVCMYSFSEKNFVNVILYLHKVKNVEVRIITDEVIVLGWRIFIELAMFQVQETGENSSVNYLFREGVPVIFENRYPRSSYFMHHKFFIVDNEILMVGSLNLTRTALVGNNESVICTDDQAMVGIFIREFSKLWSTDVNDSCPVGGKNYKPV